MQREAQGRASFIVSQMLAASPGLWSITPRTLLMTWCCVFEMIEGRKPAECMTALPTQPPFLAQS
jgi:hypothetical protein